MTAPPSRLRLEPRLAPLRLRLGVLVTAVLALAVLTRRIDLVALGAPALGALAGQGRGPGPAPAEVSVSTVVTPARCFEGEPVAVQLLVRGPAGAPPDALVAVLRPGPGVRLSTGDLRRCGSGTADVAWQVVLEPVRWGRWSVGQVRVDVRTAGHLRAATGAVTLAAELTVFPRPALAEVVAAPRTLPYGVGDHASRQAGAGVEFADIRRYAPGDPARRINWPVSTRRQALYVTSYAAERPIDAVVMVDAFSDVGPPGTSSLDLAVRGAAGLAAAYLRQRDRVGFVVVGGRLRWLAPGLGERQFYRIAAAVLAVRRDGSHLQPALSYVPRAALPPGAVVVVFTPLLDDRCLEVLRDLRQRGTSVVVVDVLAVDPPVGRGRMAAAAVRLWRLEREANRATLADLGVAVTSWDGSGPLGGLR